MPSRTNSASRRVISSNVRSSSLRQPAQPLRRHAIGAAEVAPVGDRDAQVVGDAPEGVHQGTGRGCGESGKRAHGRPPAYPRLGRRRRRRRGWVRVRLHVDLLSIRAMRVLVLYESRRGFTLTVARALRDALRAHGVEATAAPLRGVDAGTIAAADALVVGTWVSGLIVVGVGPAPGTRPGGGRAPRSRRAGRPWCSARARCRRARRCRRLSDWLEARGADVRGRVVFRRKKSLANAPGGCREHPRGSVRRLVTGRVPRARVGG